MTRVPECSTLGILINIKHLCYNRMATKDVDTWYMCNNDEYIIIWSIIAFGTNLNVNCF